MAEAEVLENAAATIECNDNRSEISALSSHVISNKGICETTGSGDISVFHATTGYHFFSMSTGIDSSFD